MGDGGGPHRLQYWLLGLQALWLVIHKLLTIASQCVYGDEWANAVSQHGYSYVIQTANSILSNLKIYMGLFCQIPSIDTALINLLKSHA